MPAKAIGLPLPAGQEFQINTFTFDEERLPTIATGSDGRFVVAWFEYSRRGHKIMGQRYDSQGNRAGTEFQVNTTDPLYLLRPEDKGGPAVAMDPSDGFVVVWMHEYAPPGEKYGVLAQRYDSQGSLLGTEFQVNETPAFSFFFDTQTPAIATGPGGQFVVAWSEFNFASQDDFMFARRFDSQGSPLATEFQVNTSTGLFLRNREPSVTIDSSGDFVIVWASPEGPNDRVFGQRYDSSGNSLGTEFEVAGSGVESYNGASVATVTNDDFVVVWGSRRDVLGRRYDSQGNAIGAAFQVNTTPDSLFYGYSAREGGPKVSSDPAGGFAVVWPGYEKDFDYSRGIVARRYDSSGSPVGTEFMVNSFTIDRQDSPVVSMSENGSFVVAWSSYFQDGDFSGVFGQQFDVPACNGPDTDGDGRGDTCDNCPSDFNPDQVNSDCPDPDFFLTGGCAAPPPAMAGCCDGADLCDVCPASKDNTSCDPDKTFAATIGAAGGGFSTSDNSVKVSVLPGAVSSDTSISVTENGPFDRFALKRTAALSVSARPEGQHFSQPVTITFRWQDRDNDGQVDLGVCVGGPNMGLSCDGNADCTSSSCDGGGILGEDNLTLKRNLERFSKDGFGVAPFRCADHVPGGACETATADCNDPAGSGRATVANCCDRDANEWTFQTCDFSELTIGDAVAGLIPGKGNPKTDCIAEFSVNNPLNDPFSDKKGLPSFKQTCTDGDATCDRDGSVNGKCTFEVAVCLNLDDSRLVDRNSVPLCTPSDVQVWKIKKPRPDSNKPVDAANAIALRDVFVGLGGGTISATVGGKHNEEITFTPTITSDVCTEPALIEVPLRGKDQDKKGKASIKMQSFTAPPAGKPNGAKDTDKIKLTCLPSEP